MNPWESRWQIVHSIGGGGQGSTFLVREYEGSQDYVLKTLKYQDDPQARRRMYQEVSNLKILKSAKADVPAIIDSNVDRYESTENLFFVMEHIQGESLTSVIKKNKAKDIRDAIELTIELVKTIKIALQEDVLHRDIKPDNILILSTSPWKAVIVDYGLSFNKADQSDVTRMSETIENSFLSLPELKVVGTKRDMRSDLTALSGILLYSLTGEKIIDLIDSDGQMPHMRSCAVSLKNDQRWLSLKSFLDKAFSPNLNLRLQTLDEWEVRVRNIYDLNTNIMDLNPTIVAKDAAMRIGSANKEFFLHNTAQVAMRLINKLTVDLPQMLNPFSLSTYNSEVGKLIPPGKYDRLNVGIVFQILFSKPKRQYDIEYSFCTEGEQIVILRSVTVHGFTKVQLVTNPTPVFWLDINAKEDVGHIKKDISMQIVEGILAIEADLT